MRRCQRSGHVTVSEHMPKAHQRYANMTPASLIKKAARIGVNAATLVERMTRDADCAYALPDDHEPRNIATDKHAQSVR